jgi:hypothetical protein
LKEEGAVISTYCERECYGVVLLRDQNVVMNVALICGNIDAHLYSVQSCILLGQMAYTFLFLVSISRPPLAPLFSAFLCNCCTAV